MNRTHYLIILLFSLVTKGWCQTAAEEYKKTMKAYQEASQFSFDVDVYAYENKTDKKAQLVGSGTAKKKNDLFYSRFIEKEILIGPKISLVVNHDQKMIECYPYDFSKKQKALKMDMTSLMDSAAFQSDTMLTYNGIREGRKHFTARTPGQMITQTDIYVDPSNNLISKVIYSYGESTEDYELGVSTVVVYYKNIHLSDVNMNKYDPDKYVSKKGDIFTGLGNYKGFKVITHKNTKKTT